MITKFQGGTISIDLHAVLEGMDASSKSFLVQSLSCDDDILKCATDQILDGYTPDGYSGGEAAIAEASPWTPLDAARRRVALSADSVASREVARLEAALKMKTEQLEKERTESRRMEEFLRDRGYDASVIINGQRS